MTGRNEMHQGLSLKERRSLSQLIAESDAPFVVLIGSWARGTQVEGISDLDVLVGAPGGRLCRDSERMHVICIPPEELAGRAAEGDDVALWCIRYGIPLSGRARWAALTKQVHAANPKPSAAKKFEFAERQLAYAQSLLDMGDLEAAQEELRIGLGHLARGLLIRTGIFPLSRPELKSQLLSAGHYEVGGLLDRVSQVSQLPEETLSGALRQAGSMLPKDKLANLREEHQTRVQTATRRIMNAHGEALKRLGE